MLGSWFGNKDADDKSRDLLAVPAGPTSGDKDNSRGPRSLASAISTPHDAVLADLHGHSKATTGTPGYPGTSASHISHQTLGASPPGSTVPAPELVHDPFEGNLLGTFVPPDANLHPEAYDPLSDAATKNEELWSHLSSVLELQSQIAGLHVGMEGIGSKAGDYGKGKGKGPILKTGKRAWQESKLRVETNDESVGTGEDEGVEADEEEQKNREREEEFARLADQFEGRKEGINEIMNKVSCGSQYNLYDVHAFYDASLTSYPRPSRSSMLFQNPKLISLPPPDITLYLSRLNHLHQPA